MNDSPSHPLRDRSRWLCIAYAFPPVNRSGTHRTLGFVKHLDRLGWDATVITAEPHGDPVDEALMGEVPSGTRTVRVPWSNWIEQAKRMVHRRVPTTDRRHAPDGPDGRCPPRDNRPARISDHGHLSFLRGWFSRLALTPDPCTGWIAPAAAAGLKAVRQRRPALIYSTAPCLSAHLVGLILARATRLPWVADFRDPWGDNPFRDLEFASLRRWDAWLERRVLARANHVVCATPSMTRRLVERHPSMSGKCSTILNGFDAHRFVDIRPIRIAPEEHFVLAHAGQFYGPRSPRLWLAALRRALRCAPRLVNRLHLLFIGPDSFEGRSLLDHARDAGVRDRIRVLGPRPHADTLAHLAGSDALMLAGIAGAGAELQIPNKLFEYLALRKPIIATCPRCSPIVDILETARADAMVCEPDHEAGLARAMVTLATRDPVSVQTAWAGVDLFRRANRAVELASLFRRWQRPQSRSATDHKTCTIDYQPPAISRRRMALRAGSAGS